ncbi:hypothetical protein [Deinococcus hopiensis]|uniref:Uncharacterized protein n=1 Tax=Deinococcus hopiensis KR-140 TaxID=695939 RepID=A0A1W1VV44_9DEIO|nr:hypothetical protein [Deinococcus hopiensis]SMB97245.1 hypothetical protein SAMN00790413_06443 [Deinococcus hopiensis KR-140]
MPGSYGDNSKERSVGLTIRYNVIDGATHLLMLEDPESNHEYEVTQRDAPGSLRPNSAYMYGNEMWMHNPAWGITGVELGDGRVPGGRAGKLYFYNNTGVLEQDGTGWGTPTTYLFAFRVAPQLQVYGRNNTFLVRSATSGVKPRPLAVFYNNGAGDFANNCTSADWSPVDPNGHDPSTTLMHYGSRWNGTGWGANLVQSSARSRLRQWGGRRPPPQARLAPDRRGNSAGPRNRQDWQPSHPGIRLARRWKAARGSPGLGRTRLLN